MGKKIKNDMVILKALAFAAEKHRGHRRKDAEATPYINHLVTVALLVAEACREVDREVVAAALLHDTLEDTDTSPGELEAVFGPRVRGLVEEVTDDKTLPKARRKELQVAHAPSLSREASMVKIADKISNVRDILERPPARWTEARRREYLAWAAEVVARCPKTGTDLERIFSETLAGRRKKGIGEGDISRR